MTLIAPRLVRLHDRLTFGAEEARWKVDPRTGFVVCRAGLSWTGVRTYRTPTGEVRVLRRPEQVNAPGHLRTLRSLPCTEGHPPDGEDVSAANVDRLGVGWTGDRIDVEELRKYPRPVADVTVSRLATIAALLPEEKWRDYCERFDVGDTKRAPGPPQTGTSLGYNALWYAPYVESEIVKINDDGSREGEWLGPHGPERYDVEHLVDPDCDVVLELARSGSVDPAMLGGNHFAIRLPPLGGRGAEQSELLAVVDSIDLPIVGDRLRPRVRGVVQVPRMLPRVTVRCACSWRDSATKTFDEVPPVDPAWARRQAALSKVLADGESVPKCSITYGTNERGTLETSFRFEGDPTDWSVVPAMPLDKITREYIIDLYLWSRAPHDEVLGPGGRQLPECSRDTSWTVGADRELPVVPGAWDGDKAAASVFAWAGFDGDSPDAVKARRAFLIYDAERPELRGSYKLPIAHYNSEVGRLEIVEGGLRAAASYLPQTDAPQDVLDRARNVLDLYFDKLHKQQGTQDAPPRTQKMPHNVTVGLSRDNIKALAKLFASRGVAVPASITVAVADEVDAAKLQEKLGELQMAMTEVMEVLAEAIAAKEEAVTAMVDMMSAAEAQAKVDEIKAALAEAEAELAKAKAAEESMTDEMSKMKAAADAMTAELAPLRAAELTRFKSEVIARGFDAAKVEACTDAAEVKRFVVVTRLGGDRHSKTRDDGSYVSDNATISEVFDAVWALLPQQAGNAPAPRSTLDALPTPNLPTPSGGNAAPSLPPVSQIMVGLEAMNR